VKLSNWDQLLPTGCVAGTEIDDHGQQVAEHHQIDEQNETIV
jgi:hypothetical protein